MSPARKGICHPLPVSSDDLYEIRSEEYKVVRGPGRSTRIRGPKEAKGAVLWLHGLSVSKPKKKAVTFKAPAFVRRLGNHRWDIFRLHRPWDVDNIRFCVAAVLVEVDALKRQGYAKIVLGGQSFGGWCALTAATFSDSVQTVISTAPACYGSRTSNPGEWQRNATELYTILRRIRDTGVILVFPEGDAFSPEGRAQAAHEILADRGFAFRVIDGGFPAKGHGAAFSMEFSNRFGSEILDFISD